MTFYLIFFTAYCLFTLPLYCARGALKVTASWHGHDNMTDSKAKAAICMRLERLQPWRPEDFGVCFPCSICHFVNRKEKKKEGKNHAADELIKVRLAQVSHKVAGARDGRLFTGWNGRPKEIHKDKRVSGGRRSWTKECCFQVNVQWNLAPLRISGWFHEAVICVCDPSSFWSHVGSVLGSYLLSARWLGTTSRDFNRTCVCLFKSQLQVFPDQLLSYMMIQAN